MSQNITELLDPDTIQAIADEVWLALVGEDEYLVPMPEPLPEDVHTSWVDVSGPWNGSVVITTGRATAEQFARVLLGEHDAPELDPEDLADAFRELANVLGGNIKAVLPGPSTLGLPHFGDAVKAGDPADTCRVDVLWRGQPLSISVQGAVVDAPAHAREVAL